MKTGGTEKENEVDRLKKRRGVSEPQTVTFSGKYEHGQ
jgi:hypothetical protein